MNNNMMRGEGRDAIGQENDSCTPFSLIKLKSGGGGRGTTAATNNQSRSKQLRNGGKSAAKERNAEGRKKRCREMDSS